MRYVPPWKLETRLQRWSGCGSYVVGVVSLTSFFFDQPWWLLPAVLALWLPIMIAGVVQMDAILRREKKWAEKVWGELERTGTLDGLSPEDQEQLRVNHAKRWLNKEIP